MFATRLAVAAAFLATAVVATVAHADGPPGACECGVTPAPSAAPAAAPRLPRWGVGAHLTSLSLSEPGVLLPAGASGFHGTQPSITLPTLPQRATPPASMKDGPTARLTFGWYMLCRLRRSPSLRLNM